jgi:thymidylate synthase ThyX
MIKVDIVADSKNMVGDRLTTFVLEFPRFILPEFATHRMFSKNAASSRAIPIEKMIKQVETNPAMPVWWGKNQSGMQAKEELSNEDIFVKNDNIFDGKGKLDIAKESWIRARNSAIGYVKFLNSIGLHKQIANRLLEPWFNIRIICSATEYQNFFALRVHPDAQPEIRVLAEKMLEEYNKSVPKQLKNGEWHIPFSDKIDRNRLMEVWKRGNQIWGLGELEKKIAIARCARISYHNYEGKDDYEADIKLCDRLFGSVPRHLSPTEHVAQAMDSSEFIGNFRGFKQYRKFFEDENLKDERVIKK